MIDTVFVCIILLFASPVRAADKPIQIAPKEISAAADTVASWLQKLEGQTAEKTRKDLGTPTKELEWKVKKTTHPKLEYRITDGTKVHLMMIGDKVSSAYAFANMLPDPTEKISTGVPRDVQRAAKTLSEWPTRFAGYTRAQTREKLGVPTKTSDWEFMDAKHLQLDYQLTRQSRLELYFLKDDVLKALIVVHAHNRDD
jgi:hypothetical protein